jgi:hypothetical protein
MNAHSAIAASPTISDIKVTAFDAGKSGQGIRIAWLDEAGARISATRFGLTASRLSNDLHVATVAGETARRFFLTGWIRGVMGGGGLDD